LRCFIHTILHLHMVESVPEPYRFKMSRLEESLGYKFKDADLLNDGLGLEAGRQSPRDTPDDYK